MNGGWRYSVTVPAWTQASLQDEDSVVFYRVEVSIMPPEHHGEPRTRSVLRRFSQFQKLHRMLKEEVGKDAVASQGLAPRWTPFSLARKPEQIERRRRELEAWLWRLIADPHIARSRVLNQFLELADAARLARSLHPSVASDASRPPPAALRSGSVASGFGLPASEEALSDFDDTGSDTSLFAAGSVSTSTEPRFQAGGDGGPGSDPFASPAGEPFGGAGSSVAGSAAGSAAELRSSVAELRLGLRVEHRGNIRRLVRALQERLERASNDLQDAVEHMRTDQETKRELYERITALEAAAAQDRGDGGGSGGQPATPPRSAGLSPVAAVSPGSASELAALLAAERQRTTDLQKALQDESGRILELQSALAAWSPAQASTNSGRGGPGAAAVPAEAQSSAVAAEPELSAAMPGIHSAGAEAAPAAALDKAPTARAAGHGAVAQLDAAADLAAAAAATDMAAEAQAAAAALRRQLAEEQASNRAKQKLLAKEVKSLRKQLEEAKAAAAAALIAEAASGGPAEPSAAAAALAAPLPTAPAAEAAAAAAEHPAAPSLQHKVLLAEVAALRQRLADCAVESMAAASEAEAERPANGAGSGSTGDQLLQTSDDRIQALAAEAALLAADPGTWSEEERQIRGAFATVLQENAQLHKAVNAALRASQPPAGASASAAGAQAERHDGHASVFARFSGGLGSERSSGKAGGMPPASAPKDGGGAGFAEFRNRLSSRFKSASSPGAPTDD